MKSQSEESFAYRPPTEPSGIELQHVGGQHSNLSDRDLVYGGNKSDSYTHSNDEPIKGQDDEDYAQGFILFTVVLALILSMFLASLDMVRVEHSLTLLIGFGKS